MNVTKISPPIIVYRNEVNITVRVLCEVVPPININEFSHFRLDANAKLINLSTLKENLR